VKGQRYKAIVFFIVLCVIQISALNYIEVFNVKPNILLVGVILLALYRGSQAGLEAGIIAGLLYSLGTSMSFGVAILPFALCGYISGFLGNNIYKESLLLRSLIVLIFSLVSGYIYYSVSSIFQAMPPFTTSIKYIILPYSLYTTLVSPLVFLILRKPFELK
jgi:rod shape-determining protein MreD